MPFVQRGWLLSMYGLRPCGPQSQAVNLHTSRARVYLAMANGGLCGVPATKVWTTLNTCNGEGLGIELL
eukprot:1161567-Pelagomonas_calceolata.AAC.3